MILSTPAASGDSGATCQEAAWWRNWTIALAGTFSGYSVALYGTVDGDTAAGNGSAWFLLPAPSEQGGTGTVQNPLTDTTQVMIYDKPLLALRAVATGTLQTGTVKVNVVASP